MSDAVPLYSAEQITVPESLPRLLKEYAKEAIRAAPADLLAWSASYFARALAERLDDEREAAAPEERGAAAASAVVSSSRSVAAGAAVSSARAAEGASAAAAAPSEA